MSAPTREWIASVVLAGLVVWYLAPGVFAFRAFLREMHADRTHLALTSERRLRTLKRELKRGAL